jgi:phosphonate degradation associated HDIG domain protein
MTAEKARAIAEEIFVLYKNYGSEDYIGEPVSQIEHMCQAAQLAEAEGYDEEIILAAFFHDIGHLCEHIMPVGQMGGYGVVDHENLGGSYLKERGFSEQIAKLVASHVEAKRYLTHKLPEYYEILSLASRATLEKQGGVMTEKEARVFETDELHTMYIKIREWDDKAKKTGQLLPSLEKYKQMAIRHLLDNNDSGKV